MDEHFRNAPAGRTYPFVWRSLIWYRNFHGLPIPVCATATAAALASLLQQLGKQRQALMDAQGTVRCR
jgi:hypothetical protein